MKKKVLISFLMIAIITVLFAISINAAEPLRMWDVSKTSEDSVTACLYKDEITSSNYAGTYYTLAISGTGNMKNWRQTTSLYTSINVPWYSYSGYITSVTIESGVSNIGDYAFCGCTSIKAMTIPEGVTSIGDYAFYDCCNLKGITLPRSTVSVGAYAFASCDSLTSIIISDTVATVGADAFYYSLLLKIYCEADSQPSGWDSNWNSSNRPVTWGYFNEKACLGRIFTFKGYSFDGKGGFAIGFAIDYDALAKYETKTGKTVQIGVVFAGYDNLGGSLPLDENGEAIALEIGRVIKADVTEYGYKYYDFMLTGFNDDIREVLLVVAGYIFEGETVKYVQENGISETVFGISYNEASK